MTIRLAPQLERDQHRDVLARARRGQQLVLEPEPLEPLAPGRRAVLVGVHDQLRAAASAPGPRRSPCRRSRGRASGPPRAARRRRRPRRPAPGAGRGCTAAARAGRAGSRCRARRSARGGRGTPCAGPGSAGARRGCPPRRGCASSVFSAKSWIASPIRCCCSRAMLRQLSTLSTRPSASTPSGPITVPPRTVTGSPSESFSNSGAPTASTSGTPARARISGPGFGIAAAGRRRDVHDRLHAALDEVLGRHAVEVARGR